MTVRYRLPNGLTVVFDEQHAARVAAFQVWVKVGSADEREDQAGLAHLHEHMLFKGTATRGPGEIAHQIEAHGGEINAWTSFDQTVYHVVIASQFARHGLEVLGDAVRSSAFDPEELKREIEVVCEEIKRTHDAPTRRASRDLFSTAYQAHPYRLPVIGTEASVRSFGREQVLAFYRAHYTPSNMVLAVCGDLSEAALRQWVEEIFGGDWGRPREALAPRPREPAMTGPRVNVRDDDVKEAYFNLGFPIPSAEHEDTPALDVLAMILGQGEASRLSLEVKRKQSLVNDIHAYAYTPCDPGLLVVTMTLPPAKLAAAIEQSARAMRELREVPVPEDELATVKALVEAEAVYQRETVQGLARKLGYYEAGLGGIEREARYYERVAGLTAANVQDVARRYLTLERPIVTGLVPPGTEVRGEQAVALLARVAAEPSFRATERSRPAASVSPMRVTAPLAARSGTGTLVVEKLSSGAKVIVRPESAVPLVAMRAVWQGGVRYETEADNGLTTLLARMLTRGTPEHDAEAISHLVDDLSGSLSATGGRNSMSVRGEFLSRHFERGLALLAACALEPTLPSSELQREQHLLLQDIATREDKPSGLVFDLFAKTLYRRHPYRLNVGGEAASVERLTQGALKSYHAHYLDPSQMTFCVVGDVDVDEVLSLAERHFGRSRGRPLGPPVIPLEEPLAGPREAKKVLAKAQAHLVTGFLGARVTDEWRRPLEVLTTVLSGQGGRLFVELRDKRSMAYSVSSFALEGVDPGYFAVYIGTSPEKVVAAREGIQVELAKVRDEKLSPGELQRAQRHLIGAHEIGLQRNGARAALMALDQCYGLGASDFLSYSERVQAVTAEQVQEVARRVIDFERAATAIVGP